MTAGRELLKRPFFALLIIVNLLMGPSETQVSKLTNPFDLADTLIGTEGPGHTSPAARVPFGMASPGPTTIFGQAFEYKYSHSVIKGFTQMHLSGSGCHAFGNILVMPVVGVANLKAGLTQSIPEDYWQSTFRHSQEKTSPGYYSVYLERYHVQAELTATERVAFHRYTFAEAKEAFIVIDAAIPLQEAEKVQIRALPERSRVEGFFKVREHQFCGFLNAAYTLYFAAQFSESPKSFGTWNTSLPLDGDKAEEMESGVYFDFSSSGSKTINVKIGLSFVSIANAYENLRVETPHWDFNEINRRAHAKWETELRKVKVTGSSEQQPVFYTALYHSMLAPIIFSDVNGQYLGFDGQVHEAKNHIQYSVFPMWDTYRTLHPLLVLINPKRAGEMVQSLVNMYVQGGRFPIWELAAKETNAMLGDPALSIVTETYIKGVRNFDATSAYRGVLVNATQAPPAGSQFQGRWGSEHYVSRGYVPYDGVKQNPPWSVSQTLELAYADWCVAQFAAAIQDKRNFEVFSERSKNYRNVFDPSTGFMRPRAVDGKWREPFDPLGKVRSEWWDPDWVDFAEGTPWQYSFSVPHDVFGLIELMGGPARFVARLELTFRRDEFTMWNEHDIHYPYLFSFIRGEAWRTQRRVRDFVHRYYSSSPSGLPGNDDMGAISAWYVWSALGLYPVAPCGGVYRIGIPIFGRVVISLDRRFYRGSTFEVRTNSTSAQDRYIRAARLDGRLYPFTSLSHGCLVRGGSLEFEISGRPSKWGDPGPPPSCH